MSGGGMPGGGSSGGGTSGGGSSGGGAGGTSSGGGGAGGAGSVGGVPQIEMPGGFPGTGGGDGQGGEGEGEGDDPFSDPEATGTGDCGDTGALPGGVGGMGQAGDCIGGGGGGSAGAEAGMSGSGGGGGGSGEGGSDGQGGEGAVAGTGGVGSVGQFPGESDAERAERLGKELEESIGGFDEVLNEEQREVASAGRNLEGFGGSGPGGGSGGVSLGEQAGDGSGGSVAVINPSKQPRVSPTAGMTQEEIRERTPDDIPVTVDDDIIARQLREAALAEDDPELRERLWEEYRKYKGT